MSVLVALLVILAVIVTCIYLQLPLLVGTLASAVAWLAVGALAPALYSPWLWLPALVLAAGFNTAPLRRRLITAPVFAALGKAMPSMSNTEREALEAGTTWWDKDLFCGKPDWKTFADIDLPTLTDDEQSFLDNEVAQLCAMLDEWDIHHYRKDLSDEAWQFLKDKGFFSLIIPKEFGGKAFSPYAQSRIMSKIATRSITAAVTAMVPNSLGPGELLMKYGTDAQKQKWLPGLANGSEIP